MPVARSANGAPLFASRLWGRSAARGTGQQGKVAGWQRAEMIAYTDKAVSTDVLEPFSLQRYRAAYAAEMAHFFDVLEKDKTVLSVPQRSSRS